MANRPSLDDYIDVAERLQDFYDAHPDGSIQTIEWEAKTVDDRTFIVYRAAAYRTPDDPRPSHGTAWEPFPGRTPYTKDSELMNAETAAWGRAIVALGLAANRGIASRQEVRNRRADAEATNHEVASVVTPAAADEAVTAAVARGVAGERADRAAMAAVGDDKISGPSLKVLRELVKAAGWDADKLRWALVQVGVDDPNDLRSAMPGLTIKQAGGLTKLLEDQVAANVKAALDATEDDGVPGSGATGDGATA